MPAGIAHAPGGVPFQSLVLKFGLGEPEDEVIFVPLIGVLLHALPDAHRQVLLVVVVEHIVLFQLGRIKVHISSGQVGIPRLQKPGDHGDILPNAVGGRLHHIRPLDVQLLAILEEGVGVELGDLHHGFVLPLGALEHFVLTGIRIGGQVAHIRDVHHPLHRVALIAQILLQHVLHDIGPEIANVGKVVHRGAAGIHLHLLRVIGDKFLFLMAEGIVQVHRLKLLPL